MSLVSTFQLTQSHKASAAYEATAQEGLSFMLVLGCNRILAGFTS